MPTSQIVTFGRGDSKDGRVSCTSALVVHRGADCTISYMGSNKAKEARTTWHDCSIAMVRDDAGRCTFVHFLFKPEGEKKARSDKACQQAYKSK
jgi:hypothetical protein